MSRWHILKCMFQETWLQFPKLMSHLLMGGIGCPICLSETCSRGGREKKRSHVCDETGCNASLIYTRLHQPSIVILDIHTFKDIAQFGSILWLWKPNGIYLTAHEIWYWFQFKKMLKTKWNIFDRTCFLLLISVSKDLWKDKFCQSRFKDTCKAFLSKQIRGRLIFTKLLSLRVL